MGSGLFCGDAVDGRMAMRLDDDLDRILDAFAGVAQRGRKILECEGVGVNLGRIEALLRHERLGAMRGALAFAANAEHVDVVADEMGDIDFSRLAWEGGKTDPTTAIDHARRFVDRIRRARAFDDVVDALAAVQPPYRRD